MLHVILIGLAILAFLAIVLEDVIHINKAKSTLFLGTLWLFLFVAMTFVAYLNQHGMVEALVYRLLPTNMPQKTLLPGAGDNVDARL